MPNVVLPCAAEPFTPHCAPMVLIDDILDCTADAVVARVLISDKTMFYRDGGVPAWVGIEYMAQTAAAWSGYNARMAQSASLDSPIGYLLGTRDYSSSCDAYHDGDELFVHALCLLQSDDGLGSFDCRILRRDEVVATARLTVYQPF